MMLDHVAMLWFTQHSQLTQPRTLNSQHRSLCNLGASRDLLNSFIGGDIILSRWHV